MDSKSQIRLLEDLADKMEKLQNDVVQIKIDLASNKEIVDLKIQVSDLKNRQNIVFGVLALLVPSVATLVWFLFKFWIEHNG